MEWLHKLTDPRFMPHGHCYLWQPEILWTHVASDVVITLAYYAIPIVLGIFFLKRRQTIPYPELVALFVAFIFLCGTTHLVSIIVTWKPIYEYHGWLKAATALVSIYTAIALTPRLPDLISLTNLRERFVASQAELQELQLERDRMQSLHESAVEREEKVLSLKLEVNELLAELGRDKRYLKES
jgi:hypothetical protein